MTGQINEVLGNERSLSRETHGATDAQLLESFIARQDEGSFETLVRRHGFVRGSFAQRCGRALLSFEFCGPLGRLKHRSILAKIGNSAQSFLWRFRVLGSTGCQPVLFGSLPKSSLVKFNFALRKHSRQAAANCRVAACAPQKTI